MKARDPHKTHKRGRISLPSIRISTPDQSPVTPTSPSSRRHGAGLSRSANATSSRDSPTSSQATILPKSHALSVSSPPGASGSAIRQDASQLLQAIPPHRQRSISPSGRSDRSPGSKKHPLSRSASPARLRNLFADTSSNASTISRASHPSSDTEGFNDQTLTEVISEPIQKAIEACALRCKAYYDEATRLQTEIAYSIAQWERMLQEYEAQDEQAIRVQDTVAHTLKMLRMSKGVIDDAAKTVDNATKQLSTADTTIATTKIKLQEYVDTTDKLKDYIAVQKKRIREATVMRYVASWLLLSIIIAVVGLFIFWRVRSSTTVWQDTKWLMLHSWRRRLTLLWR